MKIEFLWIQLYSSTRMAGKTKQPKKKKRGEKKQRKERHKKQKSKELREGSPTNNFLVGNYGLRRAERWEDMPSMSSEMGEI